MANGWNDEGAWGSASRVPVNQWFPVDTSTGAWDLPGQPATLASSAGMPDVTAPPVWGGRPDEAPLSLGQASGGFAPALGPQPRMQALARADQSGLLTPQPSTWENIARAVGMSTPTGRAILQGFDQQQQQGLTNRLALRRQQVLEDQEARQATQTSLETLRKISEMPNKTMRNLMFERYVADMGASGQPLPTDMVEAFKKSSLDEGKQMAAMLTPMFEAAGIDPAVGQQLLQEGGDPKRLMEMIDLGLKTKKDTREQDEAKALQHIQAGGTLGEVSGVTQPAGGPAAEQRPRGYVESGTTQPIVGSEKLTPTFTAKATEVANRLNMNPQDLLRIISFETGGTFNPAERNRAGSGATGLIQFTEKTAKALGTTTEALAKMTPEQQLDYVEKYLSPYKGKLGNLKDAYLAVLKPAALGQGLDAPLFTREHDPLAYRQNAGLDTGGKGQVTVGDALGAVMRTTTGGGTQAPAPDTRMQVAGPGAPASTPQAPSAADSAALTRLKQAIATKQQQIQQASRFTSERANRQVDNYRADLKILQDQHDRLEDRLTEGPRALAKQQLLQKGELEKAEAAKALTPIATETSKTIANNNSLYRSIGKIETLMQDAANLPPDFINLVSRNAPEVQAALANDPTQLTGIIQGWKTQLGAASSNDPRINRFLSALGNLRDLAIAERAGASVTGNELTRATGAFFGSLPNINQAFSLFAENMANVKERVMDQLVTMGSTVKPLAGGKAVYGGLPKEVRDRIERYESGEYDEPAAAQKPTTTARPKVIGPIRQSP